MTTRSDALRRTARMIALAGEDGKGEKGQEPILLTLDGALAGL